MQMIYCPNCQKRSGFKRALGFGTFFMVLITFGLWLLVIPLYPARCINCGTSRGEAVLASMPKWARVLAGVLLAGIVGLIVIGTSSNQPQSSQPVPILKGPDYNEVTGDASLAESVPTSEVATKPNAGPTPQSVPVSSASLGDPEFREDGRVYSVALINSADIAVGADVLAQGKIKSFGYASMMRSRPFAVIEDEQEANRTLMCAMREDEGAEVFSLYHVGEAVAVSGDYFGTTAIADNPPMPIVMNCRIAGPQANVVRPR